jgi:crossover junction endodeoxyribonuclease RuvC
LPEVILGIDPGLTRCGYGLILRDGNRALKFIDVGVFQSDKNLDVAVRIKQIADEVHKLLKLHKPTVVAIEKVFSQQNLNSVISVAQVSGSIIYLCQSMNIPVSFYTPTEVKAAVTGSGKAKKEQIGNMVVQILKLEEIPRPADAADALAIAITSVWRGSKSLASSSETKAQKAWRTAEEQARKKAVRG